MNPAKAFIRWATQAFSVGPEPAVERLPEKEAMDELLEQRPLLGSMIILGLAVITVVAGTAFLWFLYWLDQR